MSTQTLIEKLPKAELHLHIEGSLEPELMFKLAQKNNVQLPYKSIEEVREAYNFSDLQSFLDIYYSGAKVLQTKEDFFEMTMEYLARVAKDNVKHVEIFFDPQTHLEREIPFSTFFPGIKDALEEGEKKFGISFEIIMCFLRHLTEKDAIDTLKAAEPYRDSIKAVGLDSSEQGHPPVKFQKVFALAREQGYLTVAHAGEEGPPEYIEEAIDILKVKRIDHGVRCDENPALVARLAELQIPLTVCPLSNVKLKVYDDLKDHNLKKLLDKNLLVTINSDDPAYFGGYMNENFQQTADALKLNDQELKRLAKNSFTASFLEKSKIEAFHREIDAL